MTFRAFIWIIVAVALWVHLWLKIHEKPETLDKILGILRALFKLLFLLWISLLIWWGAIYWIWWFIKYWDTVELPDWLNNIIAVLWMWFIIGSLIYYWWITIKNHWWFKKRIKYLRDKRIARKKRIANLKWEEKERYEKKRRDWIIIIICLSIVFAPWIIIEILNLFWAGL